MKLLKTRFKKDIVEIVSGNAQGSELDLSYIPAQKKIEKAQIYIFPRCICKKKISAYF